FLAVYSLFAVFLLLRALSLPHNGHESPAAAPPPPPFVESEDGRLVVLVVFDQLRADYLERWQDLFGEGGFRRLQADGAWFTNCRYPYSLTETGPGHA